MILFITSCSGVSPSEATGSGIPNPTLEHLEQYFSMRPPIVVEIDRGEGRMPAMDVQYPAFFHKDEYEDPELGVTIYYIGLEDTTWFLITKNDQPGEWLLSQFGVKNFEKFGVMKNNNFPTSVLFPTPDLSAGYLLDVETGKMTRIELKPISPSEGA